MIYNFCHYFVCIAKVKLKKNFMFNSNFSVKIPILQCLCLVVTKTLGVKILVPKLQTLILLVTKNVQLEPCNVPTVPLSPQNPKMILSDDIAKKHSAPNSHATFKCKLCYQECPGFSALRQHKNTQHGLSIKTANVDPDDIINEVDHINIKEEILTFNG